MPTRPSGPQRARNIQLILFLAVAAMGFYLISQMNEQTVATATDYGTFMTKVEAGEFQSVIVDENSHAIQAQNAAKEVFITHYVGNDDMADTIRTRAPNGKAMRIDARPLAKSGGLGSMLIGFLPILLLVVLFMLFMRNLGAGQNKAMSFGKSKAKLLTENQKKVTFADVILDPELEEEAKEIVTMLKDPKKLTSLGGKAPKGVLMMGPPGNGKTLIARAIAGEAGVPFFSISGSDFVEMFVGVGASRVRDLFEQGKKNAPCIIFIDEIDAVGRHRGAGMGGGHDEREQTLNQLLVEMDGFENNDGVILIAATNRPDVLDPALIRPGRFDRKIVVPRPVVTARGRILLVHTKNKKMAKDFDYDGIAQMTPGWSGADLENLANEAALIAARAGATEVATAHAQTAFIKILAGTERPFTLSVDAKTNTAWHESGHTLLGLRAGKKVHGVTIVPRGQSLGSTWLIQTEEAMVGMTRDEVLAEIRTALAGREAELLHNQKLSTGPSNDYKVATRLANSMVREWGMDDEFGPVSYASEGEVFLGRDYGSRSGVSAQTEYEIEKKVRDLLNGETKATGEYLKSKVGLLKTLADQLIVKETLTYDEILALPGFEEFTRIA